MERQAVLSRRRHHRGFKHVFLDLDGTVTDPREGIVRSIQHSMNKLGCKLPDDCNFERFIGPPLANAFRTLLDAADEALIEKAIEAYRERFTTVGIYENRIYSGVPEVLDMLHGSGRRLFLLTVKPTVFAERILAHFNLRQVFHAVYGSDLADRSPDKTVLLARAMETEKLQASQVVVVGDREDDVTAARRNGVAAIAVTWGYGSLEELENAGPRWLVHTPRELLTCLGAAIGRA